ncbi:hypothetical protein C8J56DRAFT_326180 [Mycena floridula]|nr:hypothetical protein C8J56DRAFT_326180 [Mycena floridula]
MSADKGFSEPSMFKPTILLYIFLCLQSIYVDAACSCEPVIIPAKVDVLVPKDPTEPFAGLESNVSDLRHVDETYNIFGSFCQPGTGKREDVIQLLVAGLTYTNQYWSPAIEEFQNYSYVSFACKRGLSSFAIDSLGVGLSSRPTNASDVQFPTSAGTISKVARHLRTSSILPGVKPFSKVIGVGHSLGSVLLTFGAIVEGAQFPFDGLLLTGDLSAPPSQTPVPSDSVVFPARDVEPLRWSGLDPAYVTTNNRSIFYPADPNSFSPRMMIFDAFTKDVATIATFDQQAINSLTVPKYRGPVAKVVGGADQFLCAAGRCLDVEALRNSQSVMWPAAKSFDVVVQRGSGHDLNLDFFATAAFRTFSSFVERFAGLK